MECKQAISVFYVFIIKRFKNVDFRDDAIPFVIAMHKMTYFRIVQISFLNRKI